MSYRPNEGGITMKAAKRHRRLWIGMLIFGLFIQLLPMEQPVVKAAAAVDWQAVGDEGFSDGGALNTSIAIDPSGTPYVVYEEDTTGGRVTVKKYDRTSNSWVTVGDASFSDGMVYSSSIAIDGSGTPYVGYVDDANGIKTTVMKYNGTSGKWEPVGDVGFSPSMASGTSIAIDRSDTPYIAYADVEHDDKLIVMKYNKTTNEWELVGSAGYAGVGAKNTSIAIDRNGTPYVVNDVLAHQQDQPNPSVVKYNGATSQWETVGNVANSTLKGLSSKMIIDANGTPYVVYIGYAGSYAPIVRKYNGTTREWETLGGAGSFYSSTQTSIAIDSSGTLYIVYRDQAVAGSRATVKKYDGTSNSWVTVGGAGFSAAESNYTSIAIDRSGTPYVVYMDGGHNGKATVMSYPGAGPYTVSAAIADPTPGVGVDDAVTLTVKNSEGLTNTMFNGAHEVTISGHEQAPGGSYGSFNGTALTAGPNTISVTFTNGVATPNLQLNKAALQTIGFSVADVATPATNTVSLTPVAGIASSMAMATDAAAPTVNGGAFARQPIVKLLDAYGNVSTGDSSTVVTASRKDAGEWTLTGTATATASAGVATFTDLGATNAAEVTGAQLAFDVTGLSPITGATVTLPWPGTAAPTVDSVTAGDSHVRLTWSEVYGSVSYAVYQRTASDSYEDAVATVSGSVYDVVGLTNGTTYYFVVKAINPSGDSAASNEVSATPRTVPEAPTGVTATAGNGQATVSFTAPANGGSAIMNYEVTASPGNRSVTGTSSPITVTGLSNGVAYTFTVKAVNGAGSSAASVASNAVTPSAPSSGGWTWTPTPSATLDPEPAPTEPVPTEPDVNPYKVGIINVDELVTRFEAAVAEANRANLNADLAEIQGHWAEKTIHLFVKLHFMKGYEDGKFRADGTITRAEFAELLNRVFDFQPGSGTTSAALSDIGNHWANSSIKKLADAGIITGYKDGTFRPDHTITREEMVIMLSRIINLTDVRKDTTKGNFNDLKDSYAAEEIMAEAQAGVINGKGNGKFDPGGKATRAEALQIILNVLEMNPQLKALLDSLK